MTNDKSVGQLLDWVLFVSNDSCQVLLLQINYILILNIHDSWIWRRLKEIFKKFKHLKLVTSLTINLNTVFNSTETLDFPEILQAVSFIAML